MKLYYFPIAPNPTRVRVYLAEKGIEVEQELVNLIEGQQKSEDHLARNPFGNLPVLELDDGSHLTESLAIIEYFEELHPDPPMIGRTPVERARARATERIAEINALRPIASIIHATNSPLGLPPNPGVEEMNRKLLPKGLAVLEQRLGDQPFLCGETPSVADCTLYSGFHFARFREFELPKGFDALDAWFERFDARPAVQSTQGFP